MNAELGLFVTYRSVKIFSSLNTPSTFFFSKMVRRELLRGGQVRAQRPVRSRHQDRARARWGLARHLILHCYAICTEEYINPIDICNSILISLIRASI